MTAKLDVSIELLSDTILSSGYSIPGAEDISVYTDEKGYPYIRGTTLKGLLRESLTNLICWEKGNENDISEILGEENRKYTDTKRRIKLTSFTLENQPMYSDDCYDYRIFTAVENGVVKESSLRTAKCIKSGRIFTGNIYCSYDDVELIKKALLSIKWIGTLRNRGFGKVSIECKLQENKEKTDLLPETNFIHYKLHNILPIQITDLKHSDDNNYSSNKYIPGSAIRGMVLSELAENMPEWFEENKTELLKDVYFLDAVPNPTKYTPLPSINGFYEDKKETKFVTVLKDGKFEAGLKRAKLGNFCAPVDNKIVCWGCKTDSNIRIKRGNEDKQLFNVQYIEKDQYFEGYVIIKNPKLSQNISKVFLNDIWIGADRYAGMGLCNVSDLKAVKELKWLKEYGYSKQKELEKDLYLIAISPFTMLNKFGEPCGLDLEFLAEKIGVSKIEVLYSSTSVSEYMGYNRTWGCFQSSMGMYNRGSVFHISCDKVPDINLLLNLQKKGLGIRKEEGFGQILFLRKGYIENIISKEMYNSDDDKCINKNDILILLRKAKIKWIENNKNKILQYGLSKSQLGNIQSLCEYAIHKNGDTKELESFFDKNIKDRGVKHGDKFKDIYPFIKNIIENNITETLNLNFNYKDLDEEKEKKERLTLLCKLFNYSRKGGK